jgi:hypothetical protein
VLAFRLQPIEPGPDCLGGKLEIVGWQVAVSAGTSVPADLIEIAVIEGCTTSRHRIARWLIAIGLRRAIAVWVLPETVAWIDRGTRDEHREHAGYSYQRESVHLVLLQVLVG